jgi:hypothetical protein
MCGTWPTFITKYGAMGASSTLPDARNDSAVRCVLWVSIALEGTQNAAVR